MTSRPLRRCRILLAWLGVAGGTPAWGASVARQIAAIYEPFRVERAALSADGRHVAFVTHEKDGLEVRIFATDNFALKSRTPLDDRRGAQVVFFAWASPDRLIVMTDRAQITAISPAGRAVTLAHDVQALYPPKTGAPDRPPTARPYGFLADEPDILLLEVTRHMPAGVEPSIYDVPEVPPDPDADDSGPDARRLAASFERERARLVAGRLLPPERWLDLVRLNTRTGKRQWSYHRRVHEAGGTLIADRSGQPRLVFEAGETIQRFRLAPASGGKAATRNLDDEAADRAAFAFHVSPRNVLGARTVPLGFGFERDLLYYAANLGRDTYGIYAFDFRTRGRTTLAIEEQGCDLVEGDAPWEISWADSPLVFDRARHTLVGVRYRAVAEETRWLDDELRATQVRLNKKFPGRGVQLLEWDDARQRFLVLVSSDADPGRYFVFSRRDEACAEYLRRAPQLDPSETNPVTAFALDLPAGAQVSGYLTQPHQPPVARPALLVWLHDGPGQRVAPGFNREAQALAAMGFAVLHVNYRGSAGAGLRQREDLRQSFDRTPLDDVLATLAWLQGRHPFDARRVAIGGEGFGGYLALRALQLHPAAFRCGVSINAVAELEQYRDAADRQYARERGPRATPLNMHAMQAGTATLKVPFDFNREMLRRFYGESGASLAPFSVARQWAALKRPILFLHDPGNELAEADRIRSLQRQLERAGRQAVYAEISSRFARGEPGERAAVIRKIGEFLNTTLYDFDVKVGELTEQDGPR